MQRQILKKKNEMKSFFSRETSRVSQTSLLMQSVRKYLPVPMFSCLRPFTRAAPVLAYLCCRLHDHALIVFTIDGFLLTEHVPSSPLAQLLHHKSLFKQLLAYLKQAWNKSHVCTPGCRFLCHADDFWVLPMLELTLVCVLKNKLLEFRGKNTFTTTTTTTSISNGHHHIPSSVLPNPYNEDGYRSN